MNIVEEILREYNKFRKHKPTRVILNHDATSELDAALYEKSGYLREPKVIFGMTVETKHRDRRVEIKW